MSNDMVNRPSRLFGLVYTRRPHRTRVATVDVSDPPLDPLIPINTPPQILNSSRRHRSRRISFTQMTNQIRNINFHSISSHTTARPRASRARRTSFDLFRLKVRSATYDSIPVLTRCRNARTHRNDLTSIISFLGAARDTIVSRRLAKQALDAARRRVARANQTIEQRTIALAIATIRQRNSRLAQTPDERSIATTTNSNSRRAARLTQTDEERSISRTTNATHGRDSRLRRQTQQRSILQAIQFVQRTNTHLGESSTQLSNHPAESSHLGGTENSHENRNSDTLSNAQTFRKRVADFSWAICTICNTRFLTSTSPPEPCAYCAADRRNNTTVPRFSAANLMDSGEIPIELSRLSPLEALLIARVHPIMSVYRVKGQQYKYSGNVINFMQEVNRVASVLPYKPADLDAILIVSRDGAHTSKEFRVRREFVRQALVWLKDHHIHYKHITICDGSLNELPEDGIPEGLPHTSGNVDSNDDQQSAPLQDPDLGGPPDANSVPIHINEFQSVGAMGAMPQPNQQSRIEKTLNHAANVEQTFAHLPFTGDVINEFTDVGYISMAFPVLFPYGNADLRQARLVKIDQTDYFKFLMKFHDGRFAKDTRFRYFAWSSLSRWRAISLGKVYVKNNPMDASLSIEEIQAMVSSGDSRLANRVSFFATSIRGSRSYWFTKLQELTAMVKQLGAPTIFFTLSAADMQWPELFKLLDPLDDIQNMAPAQQRRRRAELLNENPCIAAWFLQARVDIFLDFLKVEFSVVDYWYRYEWQNRGSGHVHGFLWLQNSPDVSRMSTSAEDKAKIIDYFDSLISTSNPDASFPIHMGEHPCARVLPVEANLENDDADYAALINWVMRHSRCGSYCLRVHKTTKKQVCRFRFPFEINETSHILEEPPNSNMFRFIGPRNDEYVCSHHREVLQTWRANIDWSAILSVQTVVNYIAKYAAKCEPASKSFTETLRDIIHDLRRPCVNAPSAFIRLLIKCVSERDVSAQEVCHLLMGHALSRSSRKVILLNVSEDKMLSSTIRRTRADNNEDNIDTDPSFVARYMQRPSMYETISLFDMAKHHYFSGNAWHTSKIPTVVRVVPAIDGDIPPNSEKWESFCRQHVILNHPYRSLAEAKGDCEVWSDRYIQLGFASTAPDVLPDPIDDDEDYEDDMDVDHETDMLLREEWMLAALLGPAFVSANNVELGLREIDLIYDWGEGLQRYPNIDTDRRFIQNQLCACEDLAVESLDNTLQVNLQELSGEQRAAHALVLRSLQQGLPIRMIVCGGAGTGKSTLIKALVHSVTHIFGTRKSVRIMAPTGVAAFNVGGATIHHELGISVDKKSNQQYTPLNGDQSRRMQQDFKDAKLIIIDEYSMVGKLMLAHIDRRFRDIFSTVTELFGNISILLVGDIRQLPPVCDRALFVSLEKESAMQVCGGSAYAGFDKAITLSQIFRQAGNEQAGYRDALERLSEGLSTRNDWDLFQTRDWSLFSPHEMESFKYALRLFPVKVSADAFNSKRLIELGKAVARISSKNNCDTASSASSDHAKGLVKVLLLSIGARVMLRSNLHTQSGLVNGAMGTVVDIVYGPGCKSPTDMPLAVMVDFDNYTGSPFRQNSMVVPIPPQTSSWKSASGVSCSRTQIPIVLCWAITIHKSQGLTLDKAVVDIGEKESLGLTFVALSRTRRLTDLAFSPMFTFERLQKIKKCVGLKWRMLEEERLHNMSTTTI